MFNQFGDLERCTLRPGNVHSAEGWRTVLEPVIVRYRKRGLDLYFRGDAAFAKPELYELLEAEEIGYAIRLPANTVLQERIGHLLTRPVGRPPNKPQVFFASFSYQAQSWTRPRRVVAKVEWHQGELYPRVGFIVTNLKRPAERVSKFYNGRGTAEQWMYGRLPPCKCILWSSGMSRSAAAMYSAFGAVIWPLASMRSAGSSLLSRRARSSSLLSGSAAPGPTGHAIASKNAIAARGSGQLWSEIGSHPGRAAPVAVHPNLPSSRRTIGLIAAEHSPDDARELVGHRGNDDVEMSSLPETIDPLPEPTVAARCHPD